MCVCVYYIWSRIRQFHNEVTCVINVLTTNLLTFQRQTTGGKNTGYETVSSYQYKKSTESTYIVIIVYFHPNDENCVLGKGAVPSHETNGVNMRQSISELDSLLDDLNHAQRVGFSNSGVNRHEVITTESKM